ncbi:hypothetical protein JCM19039_1047 [Geomicrobium sp. JCM 19039]|nr:hypothetical protein JCM19039_1047 [Geomicrobium sp. JCM 19039]
MPMGVTNISKAIPIKGRRGIIYIQSGLNPIIKKIILAEEFCHLYSHEQKQLEESNSSINKVENQAKTMAAYLLMPSSLLGEVYISICQQTQAVLVSEIADHFLVTEEFAHYRLELAFGHPVHGITKLPDGSHATIQMFEE